MDLLWLVVIPRGAGEAVGVEVADLLEANRLMARITFTPKPVVDSGIAESLADFAAGRSYGPFKTDKELIESIHRESAKVRSETSMTRASIFGKPA